jgi:hypothetical protein
MATKPISMYCHECGDIRFYGMPCACHPEAQPQLRWTDEPRSAVKVKATVDLRFPGTPVYVDGPRAGQVAEPDPWVVVGTTTIDGTFEQVREMFGETWDNVDHMRYHLASGDVWNIGGRSLMIKDREVFDGGVLVCCDIVRRQSEIDAEQRAELATMARKIDKEELADYFSQPTCPECGPHGNTGRVLGADIWYPCTLCAGGRPGDMHEVRST